MPMKNPPHPGGVVLCQCIEPLGLSIAAALGVTRNTLSELVNAKRGLSPEMAVRPPASTVTSCHGPSTRNRSLRCFSVFFDRLGFVLFDKP
jgi:addiction module HigA family antidote